MFIHVKHHLGQSLNFLHRLYFCLGFYESNMVNKKVSKKVREVCNIFFLFAHYYGRQFVNGLKDLPNSLNISHFLPL